MERLQFTALLLSSVHAGEERNPLFANGCAVKPVGAFPACILSPEIREQVKTALVGESCNSGGNKSSGDAAFMSGNSRQLGRPSAGQGHLFHSSFKLNASIQVGRRDECILGLSALIYLLFYVGLNHSLLNFGVEEL